MSERHPVTCHIRYELDLSKLSEFEAYAREWIVLIERYGGTHHGYFLPRETPGRARISFPQVGRDGPPDVAVAMFSFPDEESYLRYRKSVANDPGCPAAEALYRETQCFISFERLFLEEMGRKCK